MRKIVFFVTMIAATALIMGADSAVAKKPSPVTIIAKGQVTHFTAGEDFTGEPIDVSVTGPWKVVVHLKTNKINFSATCQAGEDIVYKVTSIGTVDDVMLGSDTLEITGATFTFKTGEKIVQFRGDIKINVGTPGDLTVDVGKDGHTHTENIDGDVDKFKVAPPQ